MIGIEKIIAHIQAESMAECEQIERAALAECGHIREKHTQAAQDEYQQLIDAGTKAAAQRLERLSSLAALEAKKQVLVTCLEMMDAAFALAAKKLRTLPESAYEKFLASLAEAAVITGKETMVFSAADLKKVGKAVQSAANAGLADKGKIAQLTLSEKTADISGGFILQGDGFEVNCSITALIERYRNELTPEVSAMLFD
ncbi:MAG: V-type ATP synthase subunit E [Oscillospiraceae bacterium]|nr:V-type ATP synthase subunit E [Oscillospiraceae bacterium]